MSQAQEPLKARIREFWSTNPMAYNIAGTGSMEDDQFLLACEAVDRVFYGKLAGNMNKAGAPMYSGLIDYERYRDKPVLEVGFGMGSMLRELSRQGGKAYGIDLSGSHVALCQRRIDLRDFAATIQQGDAEQLPYEENSFDLVVSHGVLHHTSDTAKCFSEIERVLRPGGQMVTMLYNRNSYRVRYLYYLAMMPKRFRHRDKRVFCSLMEAVNWASDIHDADQMGAPVANIFTQQEVSQFCKGFSSVKHMTWDYLHLLDYFPFGMFMPRYIRKQILGRFGYFLITNAFK